MKILMSFLLLLLGISNTPILIGWTYRLPNSPLFVFTDYLRYQVRRNIDNFLGDFITDGFEEARSSKKYNLKVSELTHWNSTFFDHVYISKSFENNKYITSVINNIYLFDHDVIKA